MPLHVWRSRATFWCDQAQESGRELTLLRKHLRRSERVWFCMLMLMAALLILSLLVRP